MQTDNRKTMKVQKKRWYRYVTSVPVMAQIRGIGLVAKDTGIQKVDKGYLCNNPDGSSVTFKVRKYPYEWGAKDGKYSRHC